MTKWLVSLLTYLLLIAVIRGYNRLNEDSHWILGGLVLMIIHEFTWISMFIQRLFVPKPKEDKVSE